MQVGYGDTTRGALRVPFSLWRTDSGRVRECPMSRGLRNPKPPDMVSQDPSERLCRLPNGSAVAGDRVDNFALR